ncbi:MAG TPA: DUF885 domain-containing protein [Myxococcales bacterium]|nr:DUF885 domain-containing protein [Myxococcales bacterium]
MATRSISALATLIAFSACSGAQTRRSPEDAGLSALADQYFEQAYFKYAPTKGTAAGLHQYDRQLEDYSRSAVDARVAVLEGFEKRFAGLQLPPGSFEAADRDLLLSDVRATLLDLTTVRRWERDPDSYSSGISTSAFVIMSRKFASPDERLRSLVEREKQMPAALDAARANLANPPRWYTAIALEQLPGIVSFFEKDVPSAFQEAKDPEVLRAFAESNARVVAALRAYQDFLEKELLPGSTGDFRLGADTFRKKLLYEEAVDIPLDHLLEVGMADLRRNQQEFQQASRQLFPGRTREQVLHDLGADHPPPGELLQAFRDTFARLRGFIEERRIVTIPSTVLPVVEETPPFMRATTIASMEPPGPFEKKATEAFFNVTLPEPGWPREQVEEHMAGFNRGIVISTSIHEAFPGHYVQFLWVQRAPDKVRQLLGCNSNLEGWAHYTEQMMLEEGYGRTPGVPEEKDAAFLKIRLGQLQDALLRNARYLVGIRMHTGDMSFEQGVEFFEKEGYLAHANALMETKRGTSDPTYLVYTLGKLQVLKLREDYRKKKGAGFSLQEFHDSFLRQGFPPVKTVRRALLGDDSPTL